MSVYCKIKIQKIGLSHPTLTLVLHQAEQHTQGERVYAGLAGFRESDAGRDRGLTGERRDELYQVHHG